MKRTEHDDPDQETGRRLLQSARTADALSQTLHNQLVSWAGAVSCKIHRVMPMGPRCPQPATFQGVSSRVSPSCVVRSRESVSSISTSVHSSRTCSCN